MRFVYHENAGIEQITLDGEAYTHAIKARRAKANDRVNVSNLNDGFIYSYRLDEIGRKDARLELAEKTQLDLPSLKEMVVGWGMVEPKIVEKTLPMLNELGVKTLGLVRLDYSQGNFKYDTHRMKRILINSCQQCGRMELMEIIEYKSLDHWLKIYPKSAWVNFGGRAVEASEASAFLIGPEGGFSQNECKILASNLCWGIESPFILRSESAIMSISAKIFG